MPTIIANQPNSKHKSKLQNNPAEPVVLTKYDTKLFQREHQERSSLLDQSFKSDQSDSTEESDLLSDNHDEETTKVCKLEPKKYDGFNVKVLPSKEKIVVRNGYQYLDPKTFSIVGHNIVLFLILHSLAFYGVYLLSVERKFSAFVALYCIGVWGGLGITAGAHRLWSHRSYKARLPLRIFLMIGQTIAGQNNLFVWCRDHRVHHRFSETDGDPHNSMRGFFFAHMGWLLRKKHPDVFIKGAKVNVDDLLEDPVIRFQKKYYYFLYFAFAVFLPTWVGAMFNEGWLYSFLVGTSLRYVVSLHSTWFVNSAAHMFGGQPYKVDQQGRENLFVSAGALGEGFHNYHHSFPYDYATSENGSALNFTKFFIEMMCKIGQAYDLRRCSRSVVEQAKQKALLINERKKFVAY